MLIYINATCVRLAHLNVSTKKKSGSKTADNKKAIPSNFLWQPSSIPNGKMFIGYRSNCRYQQVYSLDLLVKTILPPAFLGMGQKIWHCC